MKYDYFFRIIIISISVIVSCNQIISQDIVEQNISFLTCEQSAEGTILIVLDENEIDASWILPFDVYYENLDNGDVGFTEMTTPYSIIIEDLATGEYVIEIELSDDQSLIVGSCVEELTIVTSYELGDAMCEGNYIEFTSTFEGSLPTQTPTWRHIWSDGVVREQGAGDIFIDARGGLSSGRHCVETEMTFFDGVTDRTCTTTTCFNIDAPNETTDYEVISSVDQLCNGAWIHIDKIIDRATGQEAQPNTKWIDDVDPTSTDDGIWVTANNGALIYESGNYCLEMTDENGCIDLECWTINVALQVEEIKYDNCAGGTTVINVVSGSSEPFSIIWHDGNTDFNRAFPFGYGNYSYTVTGDDGLCTQQRSGIVEDPINLDAVFIRPSCDGGSSGIILLDSESNEDDVIYVWSTGTTGPNLTGVGPGVYTVTAVNSEFCFNSAEFVIPEIELNITGQITQGNICKGQIDVSVEGFNGDIEYVWHDDNSINTQDRTELCTGAYTVTVIDEYGCKAEQTFLVENLSCLESDPKLSILANWEFENEPGCNNDSRIYFWSVYAYPSPPYYLRMTRTDVNTPGFIPFDKTVELGENYPHGHPLFKNAYEHNPWHSEIMTKGDYEYVLTNKCDEVVNEEHRSLCSSCNYIFDVESNTFYLGGDGRDDADLKIFIDCPCKQRCGITRNAHEIRFEGIKGDCEYKIIWPDDKVGYSLGHDERGEKDYSITEDDFHSPEPLPVKVIRECDGCEINLQIYQGEPQTNTIIYSSRANLDVGECSSFDNHLKFIRSTASCKKCIINGGTANPSYVSEELNNPCSDIGPWQKIVFAPNKESDPCFGGGKLTVWRFNDQGKPYLKRL